MCWSLSRILLLATPCSVARQIPLSMGFSRQEYWDGLPFPAPKESQSIWGENYSYIIKIIKMCHTCVYMSNRFCLYSRVLKEFQTFLDFLMALKEKLKLSS